MKQVYTFKYEHTADQMEEPSNVVLVSTDDVVLSDIIRAFRGFLVASGYSKSGVDQFFTEED